MVTMIHVLNGVVIVVVTIAVTKLEDVIYVYVVGYRFAMFLISENKPGIVVQVFVFVFRVVAALQREGRSGECGTPIK